MTSTECFEAILWIADRARIRSIRCEVIGTGSFRLHVDRNADWLEYELRNMMPVSLWFEVFADFERPDFRQRYYYGMEMR